MRFLTALFRLCTFVCCIDKLSILPISMIYWKEWEVSGVICREDWLMIRLIHLNLTERCFNYNENSSGCDFFVRISINEVIVTCCRNARLTDYFCYCLLIYYSNEDCFHIFTFKIIIFWQVRGCFAVEIIYF